MECLKMDYRFTAILIIMMTLLALFGGPAHSRNEYLNVYGARCGDFETRIEKEDRNNDYRHNSSSNDYDNNSDNDRLSVTYRHYIGTACTKEFRQVQQENMELKQQLELMKMCGRVNSNPTLKHNPSFNLLVSKCVGVAPTGNNTRPSDDKSLWDNMKDDYKKENPDITLMGDKFIKSNKSKLKIPPKDYILPLPKPTYED